MKLYLSEQDVLSCLPMPKAMELVEEVFRQFAAGTAINHPRRRVILPTGSVLHYMAGGTPDYFGLKAYSVNAKSGVHFEVLLYRSGDGMPLATFEANHLGQIRTGAASGVATKFLAREDAAIGAVIGTGFQAQTQLEAIANARPLKEIRVWSRKPERRADFARRCTEKLGLIVKATETAQECVEGADVIATATASKTPVIETAWVKPGAHINAAGANWAERRELPADLVLEKASLVAVDSIEVAKIESGDILMALKERPDALFPAVEFPEIAAGKRPGRTNPDQITIFKSNGMAIEDIAVAGHVYEESVKRGLGQKH